LPTVRCFDKAATPPPPLLLPLPTSLPAWIDVRAITIDSQNLQKVDFIKMDMQGAEGLALKGMKKLIERQDRLTILMEYYPERLRNAGTEPEIVLKNIEEAGFSTYNVNEKNGELEPVHDVMSDLLDISGKFVRDYGYTICYW
jgi:hypothetical protein